MQYKKNIFVIYSMKFVTSLFLFITLSIISLQAQTFVLQGKVLDEQSNPIELATISVISQGKITFTSLKGEYSLMLQSADSVVVKYSMVGYKTKTRVLRNPRSKQTIQIVLHSENVLDEVKVTGIKKQTKQVQELKIEDTKHSPSASGNAIEELIQSQAGVSTHNELSSQYNVRGGSFDENSVYINNVEVYRPFLVRSGQQEGLSVINPNMVEKVEFSTGGFDAKYGDKMSSALDITYKRPTFNAASLSLSLLGATAYGVLANKKMAWSNSVRYKTNKYLLGTLQTKGEYEPTFLDYQTFFTYQPNERWELSFIGNIAHNLYNFTPTNRETNFGTQENVKSFKVYFDGTEKDLFRTYFGSLSLKRNITTNTSLSLILSAFNTKEQETYDIQGQYWLTQTETSEDLGVGTYFLHTRNLLNAQIQSLKLLFKHRIKKHEIESGLTLKWESIKESLSEYEMRDSSGYTMPNNPYALNMIYSLRAYNELKAQRVETYLQDTYRFTSSGEHSLFTLNYGIRFSNWSYNKETLLSPRISLGITPAFNHHVTMRFATGLYYQAPFFKELRAVSNVNNHTSYWLNDKIKSQLSWQFISGFDYHFKLNQRPFKFTAEAYYKYLNRFIPYTVNNVKLTYYTDKITNGFATGVDFKLYGEFVPGTDSWMSFSLMKTQMNINGKRLPLPTDQRYAVNLFFTDYFPGTERWKMSLKLAFADGLPFSAPHKEFEDFTFRTSAYRRVDIGLSYSVLKYTDKQRLIKNMWLGVDCLNLFGINNVNSYYWITDVTNQQYAVPNYLTGRQINAKLLIDL